MPLFSVIIPVFNRAALLRDTLTSVVAQRLKDFECIVVDDGSSDNSLEVAHSSAAAPKIFRQENRGPGAARNLGAQHATGEYVACLDSDDVWFPWTLRTYAEVIKAIGHPSFVAGKPLRFRSAPDLAQAREQGPAFAAFPDYLASGDEWRWWGASSFVIRRDALLASGGFPEENINGEDADLALKLGTTPGFVQVTAPVTFGYRNHPNQVTSDVNKTLAGLWHKIGMEQGGHYPGGAQRAKERWRVLTRHMRPMILRCLTEGHRAEAWKLYRETFRWHAALGRWKFLLGFPWQALTGRSDVTTRAA